MLGLNRQQVFVQGKLLLPAAGAVGAVLPPNPLLLHLF
jgi:hypothetical protein